MAKITVKLYGREYQVNCGPGEEDRLQELVGFVEGKMQEVAGRAGSTTESRLLMLTCLLLADELLEARRQIGEKALADEGLLIAAVEHLKQRVTHIASQVGRA
jgi:cell division protein ZapA